jgi:hypothetical protein
VGSTYTGQFSTFDAKANFTITTQPSNVTLGGPHNINEGIVVTYYIQSKPGLNGTFDMGGLGNSLPLPPNGVECGSAFHISAGTGSPNYSGVPMCYVIPPSSSSSYPLPPDFLFVEIIGVTNPTG